MSEKYKIYPKYVWMDNMQEPNICFIADLKWYYKHKHDLIDWCKLNNAEHWGNEFVKVQDPQSRLSFELRFRNLE